MKSGLANFYPNKRAISNNRLAKSAEHIWLEAPYIDLDRVDSNAAQLFIADGNMCTEATSVVQFSVKEGRQAVVIVDEDR